MNILFLTKRIPYPPHSGYQIYCLNALKQLSKRHSIFLLSFMEKEEDRKNFSPIKNYTQEYFGVVGGSTTPFQIVKNLFSLKPLHVSTCQSQRFNKLFNEIVKNRPIDLIWVNHYYLSQFVMNNPLSDRISTMLVQHGFDRDVWLQIIRHHPNIFRRIYSFYNLLKTKHYENRVYAGEFDLYFFLSSYDFKKAKPLIKGSPVYLTPSGVDINYYTSSGHVQIEENSLLFTGGSNQRNVVAVKYFYGKIFPKIKKSLPSVKFIIAGNMNKNGLLFLKDDESVTITGKVRDLRPYFEKAMVYIAPFQFGGGTKLKILEALAMKKPVVSTPAGCQGIDVENNKNILVAEQPTDFASKIIKLLEDKNLREKIAKNGRELVERKYDWNIIFNNIEEILANLEK